MDKKKYYTWCILAFLSLLSILSFSEMRLLIDEGEWLRWNGLNRAEAFSGYAGAMHYNWLKNILYYLAETYAPAFGPIAIYLLSLFILFSLLYQTSIFKNNGQEEKAQSNVLLFGILLICFISITNAYVESIAFYMYEVFLLERYTRIRKGRLLASIPLLTTLQLQFDAYLWPILIITMIPYIMDYTPFHPVGITYGKYKKMPVVMTLIASFFAGYINPYSEKSVAYTNFPFADGYDGINPIYPEEAKYLLYAVAGVIVICIFIYVVKMESSIPIRYVYLMLGFFIMLFFNISYFVFFLCISSTVSAYVFRTSGEAGTGRQILQNTIYTLIIFLAVSLPLYEVLGSFAK